MKQTAVEWYAVETGKLEVERAKGYLTFPQMFNKMLEILNQAKEMEKEQIIKTAEYYFHEHGKLTPQQYYNETFKSE